MKKALITGASSGIGRALAHLLADRGVELIIHGRDVEALKSLQEEIGNKTIVKTCVAELASYDGSQTVLKMLQEEFPDVVINSAGFGLYGDLNTHGPHEIQQMIAANCAAVVAICQHITYWWLAEKCEGTILNISSALGIMPSPGATVYGATKAFVNSFSEALDIELAPHGIRVLVACPGRVSTKFANRASKGKLGTLEAGGMVLDAKDVALAILKQLDEKQPFKIINWKYRLLILAQKLVPRRFAMKKLYASIKARAKG